MEAYKEIKKNVSDISDVFNILEAFLITTTPKSTSIRHQINPGKFCMKEGDNQKKTIYVVSGFLEQ